MSVLMEDRADLLRRRIELYRYYLREGVDRPVAAAQLRGCRQVSPQVFRTKSVSADRFTSAHRKFNPGSTIP
jgi:hypothetical protein